MLTFFRDYRLMDLSILIVTRDRPAELRRCLASIKTEDKVKFEIVLIDNGSRVDNVRDLASDFPSIRYFRLPKNYGDWEARDIGRLQCNSPFILSLDDDAELQGEALTRLLTYARALPRAAVIQPRVLEPSRNPGRILGPLHDPDEPHLLAGFLGGACLYRADALELAGGFPHFLLGGAEPFLTYRFFDLGFEIVYVPDVTIIHWATPTGRVLWKRLYLSSKGRLRAILRNEPRLGYRLLHLCWKPLALGYACMRRGLYLGAVILPFPLFLSGVADLAYRPQTRIETVKRLEAIRKKMHYVSTSPCGSNG